MALLLGSVAACNNAKSPEQVAKDTAAAQHKAAEDTAKAEKNAQERVAKAENEVRDQQGDATHTQAVQEEKVDEEKAKGDHDVALAQCERLNGSAQKACKDQADTAYNTAVDRAKQAAAATEPGH
jgi:hypothetical protein